MAHIRHIAKILSKRDYLFLLLLVVFAAEAGWLAITSNYPMAYDESYHFGLIQFFGHHLNPFVSSQPASSYPLGNIVHNPSFLYHYLLSFPYRVVSALTGSLRIQVTTLRFFSIGLALASLVVIKRNLRLLSFPNGLANAVVLVLAFTPAFTALSAQMNYDNLLILCVGLALMLTIKFVRSLQQNKLSLWLLGGQLAFCLIASEVKFAFLPAFVGVIAVDVLFLARYAYRHGLIASLHSLRYSFKQLTGRQLVILSAVSILGMGLFAGFYGIDLVKYHNPEPQCNQVLSIAACKQYYSWDRNYELAQNKTSSAPTSGLIGFSHIWIRASYDQLFAEILPFASTGNGMTSIKPAFTYILVSLMVAALICTLINLREIVQRNPFMIIAVGVAVVYVLFLWSRNYYDYDMLGEPVGIQGRYLLPVLVYFYALLALGVWYSLQRNSRVVTLSRLALAAELVLVFLYFGGFSSYKANISPLTGWPAVKHPAVTTRAVRPNHG